MTTPHSDKLTQTAIEALQKDGIEKFLLNSWPLFMKAQRASILDMLQNDGTQSLTEKQEEMLQELLRKQCPNNPLNSTCPTSNLMNVAAQMAIGQLLFQGVTMEKALKR